MANEKIIELKKQEVTKLAERFKKANIILLTDYRGINAEDVTKLRKDLGNVEAEYSVIKNNIIRRAFEEMGIKDFEEKDPLLPLNGLIATGKQFAGSLDTQNPLISPIYGNMDNLKEIFLIFGTNEILYPDCLKLEKLLKTSNGTKVKTKIGKNLCHDWILAPLKETKETIDEICNFYLNS